MTAPTGDSVPIYTVGYGARSVDELFALLRAHALRYLLDVRSAPYSKFKPEFSRDALATAARTAGLEYRFLGDQLGGQPDDPRCYQDGKVIYEAVARTPAYREGIARLEQARARGLRVALMCSEGKPELCHRSKLIGETLTAEGIPVLHIDEVGAILTHAEVMERLTGGQLTLFGESDFTSRKRHRRGSDGDSEEGGDPGARRGRDLRGDWATDGGSEDEDGA